MKPRVVELAQTGASFGALEAVAGKLWLDHGGNDPDGALRRAVEDYWSAQSGADPYWDQMSERMSCSACGDTNRLENLSVCPNCLALYCYRHGRDCPCGFKTLG